MPFMPSQDCRCCQEHSRKFRKLMDECRQNGMESAEIFEEIKKANLKNDHCEDCWNKYHNGLKHKDYEERGRFKED